MDLMLTSDQESIVDAVASFLDDQLPRERVRELVADPASVTGELWAQFGALGWFGLGLPEEHGGAGLGLVDEILLFREIGRRFVPGPFLAAVLGARIAAFAGEAELAGRILAGEAVVGLAVAHPEGEAPAGATVSGTVRLFDATGASHVVLVDDGGAALLDVAGLTARTSRRSIDPGTVLEQATADGVDAVAFVPASDDPIGLRGAVLTSALLSGLAEQARDLSAEHARTRFQFGKPIGVNQAIKHACTDMAIRAEAGWAQTCFAALRLEEGAADLALQVAAAKVVAGDAALANASATVQVHGGMGFTDEHDAHLLVKRAQVLDHVCGSKRAQLDRVLATPPAG
jgi:alkylation response protein AidB-like acyl-CoA dehydrogenase